MRECNLKRTKNLTKIGGGLPECEKVFFLYFFWFWWFCFFCFSAFLCFCFVQNSPKWLFPAFLEVFCLFCSHITLVLNCFFSSYFVLFAFVFPYKNPYFSLLLVHQPLFRKDSLWGFFCFPFACLFLMFACLFETNFPNIPFVKPKLLSFLAVSFFLPLLSFCFHGVCFSLSVSMLALFCLSFFLFLFSCFLCCFQSMKNVSPAILVFLSYVG